MAEAANTDGRYRYLSCQAGTAVLAMSAAVYVATPGPIAAAVAAAAAPAGVMPVRSLSAAAAAAGA
jgi:hypothetical protein